MSARPFALATALWLAAAAASAAAEPFVVIVNAANPVTHLSRQDVSHLLLKQTRYWPGGRRVNPVDLAEGSPVREAFSRAVHRRSASAVTSYWQRMIFAGREIPPPKKSSEDAAVAFVARYPGGVGYVSRSTPLPPAVRVLRLDD